VEAIAEAFIGMQSALQDEKRAAQRQWAKREKQIRAVISNTAGMYGELQALTGLPDLPALTAGTHEPEISGDRDGIVVRLPSRELRRCRNMRANLTIFGQFDGRGAMTREERS